MTTERLEVRLDSEIKKKLNQIAEIREESVSEVVRQLILEAFDDAMRERRREAVRRIAEANVEDVPDPAELSRQLDRTYDAGSLY
jgi:predicted transcriptional regulator